MFSIAVEIGRRIRMFVVKSSVGSNVRSQASRLVEHSVTLMEYSICITRIHYLIMQKYTPHYELSNSDHLVNPASQANGSRVSSC